jgi:hypothetical protein
MAGMMLRCPADVNARLRELSDVFAARLAGLGRAQCHGTHCCSTGDAGARTAARVRRVWITWRVQDAPSSCARGPEYAVWLAHRGQRRDWELRRLRGGARATQAQRATRMSARTSLYGLIIFYYCSSDDTTRNVCKLCQCAQSANYDYNRNMSALCSG